MQQRCPVVYVELPMVTPGDDLAMVRRFISPEQPNYSARDVLDYLLETSLAPKPEAEATSSSSPMKSM